ncbi:MAG: hypothetical protein ACR2I2_08145, partial [Bryobacteraceae bacterium]
MLGSRAAVVRAIAWAMPCSGIVLLWQSATVHFNFGGNWTALYCTGDRTVVPPALSAERIYRFANSPGYDGQFYHFIAHDPAFSRGFSLSVDDPRMRWRRILIPGLAFIAAAGRTSFIDKSYLFVELAWIFAGAYWASRYCTLHGRSPAWGLCFALVPATLVSIDRLTIDTALAALTVGYAWYAARNSMHKLYAILLLAPLARETGLALIAGYLLYLVDRRNWRRACWMATSAIPFAAWAAFVHAHTAPDPTVFASGYPLGGIVGQTIRGTHIPSAGMVPMAIAIFDDLVAIGIWLALAFTVRAVFRGTFRALEAAAATFAILAIFLSQPGVWVDGYGLGRAFSPWLLLLALIGIARGSWWYLLPLGMAIPRVVLQLAPQVSHVIRG